MGNLNLLMRYDGIKWRLDKRQANTQRSFQSVSCKSEILESRPVLPPQASRQRSLDSQKIH